MDSIVDIFHKGRRVEVIQTQNDRFSVYVDGIVTQQDKTGEQIIRWFGNAMHEEPKVTKE